MAVLIVPPWGAFVNRRLRMVDAKAGGHLRPAAAVLLA